MTNVAPASVRARAFDAWAADYDRFRPAYPPALFDLVADRLELRADAAVVDLGAGTGKVARATAARGWRTTAVEPGEPMLAVLRDRAAAEGLEIESVLATAERTGLPDGTFDAALAGEAYHWFDAPAALAEMGRIVRPGGGIALFWNMADAEPSALVAAERDLTAEFGLDGMAVRRPGPQPETHDAIVASGAFEVPDFVKVPHTIPMTGAEYVGLAYTKSHMRTAPADVQERYRSAFEAMVAGQGIGPAVEIEVPYVVECWIARRRR